MRESSFNVFPRKWTNRSIVGHSHTFARTSAGKARRQSAKHRHKRLACVFCRQVKKRSNKSSLKLESNRLSSKRIVSVRRGPAKLYQRNLANSYFPAPCEHKAQCEIAMSVDRWCPEPENSSCCLGKIQFVLIYSCIAFT